MYIIYYVTGKAFSENVAFNIMEVKCFRKWSKSDYTIDLVLDWFAAVVIFSFAIELINLRLQILWNSHPIDSGRLR